MLAAGQDDPLGVHGGLIMAAAILGIFGVISGYFAPEPAADRLDSYYDEPSKIGILLAMGWAAFGLFVGDWVAWQLAYPDLNFDAGWSSFGRLRPVHTTSVIFGFGGNALIATSFYVMQRTSRARLPDQLSPLFVVFGYNLFCLLAVTGYMMGVTQSKEYAEPEWYADIWLVVVWVTYFVVYLRTLARRKEPHIYVANWYYMAFILVVAMLHIVNNLAVPVSLGSAKSYSLFAGVQDAMTAVVVRPQRRRVLPDRRLPRHDVLLPAQARRPAAVLLPACRSSASGASPSSTCGPARITCTTPALPQWVQTLGMTFSVMLLVPSWASAANALLTLNGAWHKVRDDATLRFMMVAAVFYGLTTFEGSFLAIRPVNALSHYTDWTVGHVHAGALGWVAMITFGSIYAAVPWLWKREAACIRRGSSSGTSGSRSRAPSSTCMAMWNSGIIQGLMWRTYNANGTLAYSFVDSLVGDAPLLHRPRGRRIAVPDRRADRLLQHLDDGPRRAAAAGGRAARPTIPSRRFRPRPSPAGGVRSACSDSTTGSSARRSGSRSAIIGVASIGGLVEIAPLFTIHQTVEDAPDMRVYTPLELAGRNIYVREGCYACHSQMIRTLRDEVERYGPYSLAVEVQVRPSDAVGLQAHRARSRAGRRQVFRRMARRRISSTRATSCRNPSCRPTPACCATGFGRTISAMHLKAMRAVGVPYTDEMIANAARRCLWAGDRRTARSPKA